MPHRPGSDDPVPTPSPGAGDARQRHAVSSLAGFAYPVELRTLARHVAAAERNVPTESVSERTRRAVAVALHHVDLPELVADGAVRYDPESRMAVSVDTATPTERYADTTERSRRPDAV